MNAMDLKEPAAFDTEDARWNAVLNRDPAADGAFYFSVATTGVYCRPSCGARTPLRRNVGFHATPAEAERAGFRPCKRCRPTEPKLAERQALLVAEACRTIDAANDMPSLEALAMKAGLSPHHFHRIFRAVAGLTPKAYGDARKAERARSELQDGASVTEAIYGAGYGSSSRFYEKSRDRLGMAPSAYRDGGRGATIRFAVGDTSLGPILVAATERGICAIQFGADPDALVRDLEDRFPRALLVGGDAEFEQWMASVVGLVEAPAKGTGLPLDVRGTAFQERVWNALRAIPAGTTASYAEIAAKIGAPKAVRAVAQACAANPTALAIPCHRVVRKEGGLSGYRWGIERKRVLLSREAA